MFFIIDDMFRAPMRSEVHPEYFLFSGVIMGMVAIGVFSGLATFIYKNWNGMIIKYFYDN